MEEIAQKVENSETSKLVVEHIMTLMDTSDEIFTLKFDPNDKYIACGCGDGAIRVFNVKTGKMAFLLPNPKKYDGFLFPITCLRWRPVTPESKVQNVLVACSADGSLYHWHVTSKKLMHTFELGQYGNQFFCLDFSPDGKQFALGAKDKTVRIMDEYTKTLVDTLEGGMGALGHSNRVFSVKYVKEDPNLLISGGWDSTILLWDLRSSKVVKSFYGPHICGDSLDLRNGKILAGSYSNKDNLYSIDLESFELDHQINWYGEEFKKTEDKKPSSLYSALYTSDGKHIIAGGASPNEVRIFKNDPEEGHKVVSGISDLNSCPLAIDVAHSSNKFAFGTADGYLRIMNLTESDE
ncbi:unnamed protein product [Moneuplotes crassus]|uniref:Anaphase-promoting complex subunit 4-like WD40 domain-containing protein n=2 Tax=Euplotes crassus TaxID=5936 RepID=A0AAD1XKB1_EUPCR|nr:unnamed protein product [Moneuplotes crassus]